MEKFRINQRVLFKVIYSEFFNVNDFDLLSVTWRLIVVSSFIYLIFLFLIEHCFDFREIYPTYLLVPKISILFSVTHLVCSLSNRNILFLFLGGGMLCFGGNLTLVCLLTVDIKIMFSVAGLVSNLSWKVILFFLFFSRERGMGGIKVCFFIKVIYSQTNYCYPNIVITRYYYLESD